MADFKIDKKGLSLPWNLHLMRSKKFVRYLRMIIWHLVKLFVYLPNKDNNFLEISPYWTIMSGWFFLLLCVRSLKVKLSFKWTLLSGINF